VYIIYFSYDKNRFDLIVNLNYLFFYFKKIFLKFPIFLKLNDYVFFKLFNEMCNFDSELDNKNIFD